MDKCIFFVALSDFYEYSMLQVYDVTFDVSE